MNNVLIFLELMQNKRNCL